MANQPRPPLSEAELAVLKLLWEQGPDKVTALQERLAVGGQDWTRSTVITLLQRLERKGYVASDRSQFAFVFRAVVSREEVAHERMTELAEELADGSAAPLVLAFAERHKFTAAEIEQFKQLIDELEAQRSSAKKPRK